MNAKYLTTEEWADIYQKPVTWVRRQIRQGRIRGAVNIGSIGRPEYRIPESERARYDRDNAA